MCIKSVTVRSVTVRLSVDYSLRVSELNRNSDLEIDEVIGPGQTACLLNPGYDVTEDRECHYRCLICNLLNLIIQNFK